MTVVRNKGTPWRRPNGQLIPINGIFEPSQTEYDAFVRRFQIGTRFDVLEDPGVAPVAPIVETSSTATTTTLVALPDLMVEQWTNKMSPREYIDRFPNGKKADLARAILARTK